MKGRLQPLSEHIRRLRGFCEAQTEINRMIADRVADMERRLAEAEKDAKRYRHARDCNSGSIVIVQILGMGDDDQVVLTEDDADAAIDAAIEREQGKDKA